LIRGLLEPSAYPHPVDDVELVQTHISYVFLAGDFVYKVKKPVNFGFLDFSTLEKRRYFSEREVMLNRRLCQGIYLGVVPISLTRGRLAFGEGEEVVEYAVKMRKLPERYFLKQRLERGEVGSEDLDRIALTLKAFYEGQEPTEEITKWGRIERLKISTDENFHQTEGYIDLTLSRPAFEALRFYTESFYAQKAPLFESRIREGRIKDCHGDLHLEHIHLSPKTLCIYDCIEFNDRFRYIDVANDIAFLAMDLDYNGYPDLARFFVSRMAEVLEDPGMLQLMDFYKGYRAYVRGKVESLRSSGEAVPEREREMSLERARRYFRLALNYAVAGSEPIVLVVMGVVGSGKSRLAGRLAQELGWEVFSSDRVRKELAGFPLYERGDEVVRSRLYAEAMTEKTYEALFQHAEKRVKDGRSVILDATFSRRLHRDLLRERLRPLGSPSRFIETQASEEVLKARLKGREGKADEVSDARLEDFAPLRQSYEPPHELSPQELLPIKTEGSKEETVIEALKGLIRLHLMRS
ncbi:MAG: AAA family ATPase, partial [Candidatus Methylomirabilales bacterium]